MTPSTAGLTCLVMQDETSRGRADFAVAAFCLAADAFRYLRDELEEGMPVYVIIDGHTPPRDVRTYRQFAAWRDRAEGKPWPPIAA